MMKKMFTLALLFLFCLSMPVFAYDIKDVENALDKGISYFHSINIQGGYVYVYSVDMTEKWGEGRTDDFTIEVQPPGTPAVGMTFLRAFNVTGNNKYLDAAKDAAFALIHGQNDLGGWEHKIHFNEAKRSVVSFDDNQTQSAIEFLMTLDQVVDNDSLSMSVEKALNMMLSSQLKDGGWPHRYPEQGNYHDFATFNDKGINDCIRVMMKAHQFYGKEEYEKSLNKVGRFLEISQLPPPQPGWAQQYNRHLQPAWARTFEPPSVCPQVTVQNIKSLMDLYEYTGDAGYLEPIPDAFLWLDDIRLPNGKWARFVELGTNKPLYYDRGRIRVNSTEELHIERRTGYGYETDLSAALERVRTRFNTIILKRSKIEPDYPVKESREDILNRIRNLKPVVEKIIKTQDETGRWITKNDRYRNIVPGVRWNGEYITKDRIKSSVFNQNINTLCEFLELNQKLEKLE